MRQAATLMDLSTVLADAGYDAEDNHRLCRDELGIGRWTCFGKVEGS
jgi:hypothetical protein